MMIVDVSSAASDGDVLEYNTAIPPFFFLPIAMVISAVLCICLFVVIGLFTGNYSARRMAMIGDYLHQVNHEKFTERGVHLQEVRRVVGTTYDSHTKRTRTRTAYWISIDICPPAPGAARAPPSDDEYNL